MVTVGHPVAVHGAGECPIEDFVTEWQMTGVPNDRATAGGGPRELDLDTDGEPERVIELVDPPHTSEAIQNESMRNQMLFDYEF
jgi:hypothetical protein